MKRYCVVTLVDITRSNPGRIETDRIKLGQQANFNSLIQAVGLRSNFEFDTDPKMKTGVLPYDIGGKANHWIWVFKTERDDVYRENNDPVFLLVKDLNGVPVISELNNNVDIDPACFITEGKKTNTWVFELDDIV